MTEPADDWEILGRDWAPYPVADMKGILREMQKTNRNLGQMLEAAGAALVQDRDELTQMALRIRSKPPARDNLEQMAEQADAVVRYFQQAAGLFLEVKQRIETAQARAEIAEIAGTATE